MKASANSDELTGEDLNNRINELRKVLKGWIPQGGIESLYDLERFHTYHILPYSGGYKEQPAYLLEDWKMLELWMELMKLLERLPKAKPGMRTIAGITG